MPRKPAIEPNRQLEIKLPRDLSVRLDLHLWSDLEERVPRGAYSNLIVPLLREFFERKRLDISLLLSSEPGTHFVYGSEEAIAALQLLLNERAIP